MSRALVAADRLVEEGLLAPHFREGFSQLYEGYRSERAAVGLALDPVEEHFEEYISIIARHLRSPFEFEPIHKRLKEMWHFGLRHTRLMLDKERSVVEGVEQVGRIEEQMRAGENVILFSNHQTELDCHLVSLLIQERAPELVEKMVWVAGDRVITDPVAVPVSLGLNLICIYSKNYIDHPPEQKQQKVHHNRQTMRQTRDLLAQGGQCIVLFPSGGRDRPGSGDRVDLSPFDPASIEMFRLLAERSGKVSHFYPLSLATYRFLPPPNRVHKDLGETRVCRYSPVAIAFGEEIDFSSYPRKSGRDEAARFVWNLVQDRYSTLRV